MLDTDELEAGKAAVHAIGLLDVVPAILDTCCRATGMGFAAVARVTQNKWIACAVLDTISFGLEPGGELVLESTICNEIRESHEPVVISDVAADPLFRSHHTPARYGFRSYISYPVILRDGRFFGTLCAIDPEPADLTRPEVTTMFKMFAELIAFHLAAQDQLETAEKMLSVEKAASGLREQFIAILGHDLRNPLASIQAGVRLLRRGQPPERSNAIFDRIDLSMDRMSGLIDDVLDFARGRLGDGIRLDAKPSELSPVISQVIAELVSSHPEREVTTRLAANHVVECDAERISQLVSNLVGNALTHGARDEPIAIECVTSDDMLRIAVRNGGDEIPADKRASLFHPFSRGEAGAPREGLGLGLFIASEIAKAHNGTLSVTSSPQETCFEFAMPLVHAGRPAHAA